MSKLKIEIKNKFTGLVLFEWESENNTIKQTILEALKSRADLSKIKYDFFGRLLTQKNEAEALKQAIIGGKIDGSAYKGECCCFVGTIANAVKCNYTSLPILKPDANSPTERWFLGIKKGDTPENSQIAKITLEWIEEFQMLIK